MEIETYRAVGHFVYESRVVIGMLYDFVDNFGVVIGKSQRFGKPFPQFPAAARKFSGYGDDAHLNLL